MVEIQKIINSLTKGEKRELLPFIILHSRDISNTITTS